MLNTHAEGGRPLSVLEGIAGLSLSLRAWKSFQQALAGAWSSASLAQGLALFKPLGVEYKLAVKTKDLYKKAYYREKVK